MKNILQLSSLFVLLTTSVIAEVIPTADEVKAVLIKVEYGKDIQFRATAEDWKEIRPHMLPARIDPKPALWAGLADATIIKKNGKSLKVTVWIPATGPGTFSVGGKYYRGGDSSKTLKAILDAHQRSIKLNKGEDDVHATIRKLTKVRSIGGASLADLGLKFVEPRRDKSSPFLVGGSNTTETILGLKSLNGIAIESLERQMRPGAPGDAGSNAGFLGHSERLLEIMAADNRFVQNLGLTHQELVRPLLLLGYYARKNHRGSEITLGGLTFTVRAKVYTSPQYSPFHDGTAEGTDVTIINKKTGYGLSYSLLVPEMIERYGFYEGKGTSYRVDPRMIIDILRTEKSPEAVVHQRLPFEPANDRELAQALAVCDPSALIELNLWRTEISDDGVAEMAGLKNLKKLNLGGPAITDKSLEGIARLANLEELGLVGTQISDEGLRHLAGLNKLTMLNLTRTGVSDEGVGALAKMADLRELHMSETKVTDDGLRALMSLNALRELSLLRTGITDQGLLMLSKLPSLRRVHTYGTKVTKEGQKEFRLRVLERTSGGR